MKLSSFAIACGLLLGIGAAHADPILPKIVLSQPPDITFADTAIGTSTVLSFDYVAPYIFGTSFVRFHLEITGSAAFNIHFPGLEGVFPPFDLRADDQTDLSFSLFNGLSDVSRLLIFEPDVLGPSNATLTITVTDFDSNAAPLATGTVSAALQGNAVPVPGPLAGAGMPGLLVAIGGLWAMRRRQQRSIRNAI